MPLTSSITQVGVKKIKYCFRMKLTVKEDLKICTECVRSRTETNACVSARREKKMVKNEIINAADKGKVQVQMI